MNGYQKRILPFLVFFLSATATGGFASMYLNGTDISSALNQDMKSVDVHVDERGNIFITAPHYYVNEAESFVPLSSAKQVRPPHIPLLRMEHEKPDSNSVKNDEPLPAALAPAMSGKEKVPSETPAPTASPTDSAKEKVPSESAAPTASSAATPSATGDTPAPASNPPTASTPAETPEAVANPSAPDAESKKEGSKNPTTDAK